MSPLMFIFVQAEIIVLCLLINQTNRTIRTLAEAVGRIGRIVVDRSGTS